MHTEYIHHCKQCMTYRVDIPFGNRTSLTVALSKDSVGLFFNLRKIEFTFMNYSLKISWANWTLITADIEDEPACKKA